MSTRVQEETDSQLVGKAREGDLSAFEAIVDRHRAALVAFAAARLGSLADAEDVAQEAFVAAFLRLHQLRKPQSLLPWLRRITERLALMRLRRHREEPLAPERIEKLVAPRAGDEGEADGLLAGLPEAMRQAVTLTYLAGYTCAETASLLGIKEGTVKSRLSRARAKLKEVLGMVQEELTKGKPEAAFTQQTMERLMREARRLLEKGEAQAAGERAETVLEMQARQGFDAGGGPEHMAFDMEAARIADSACCEKRKRDCEANAAQYGYCLEDLDWRLAEVDVLCATLGGPTGEGKDLWGIPLSRQRIQLLDARDVCRRLRCSPQTLSDWVKKGCPILRCWPFARFDLDRVKRWLDDSGIKEWPTESDRDLDRPIRVIFKALHRQELRPEEAETIVTDLGYGVWG